MSTTIDSSAAGKGSSSELLDLAHQVAKVGSGLLSGHSGWRPPSEWSDSRLGVHVHMMNVLIGVGDTAVNGSHQVWG